MASEEPLAQLVPPPRRDQLEAPDWSAVHERMGVALPRDYKWLVERYGAGTFDGFLHVFQPAASIDAICLEHQVERAAWTLNYLRERGENVPYAETDLLPVAGDDNGNTYYLLRRPVEDPDLWTVVINEARGPQWESFDGGLTDFVHAALSRSRRFVLLPEDFPGDEPTFSPY